MMNPSYIKSQPSPCLTQMSASNGWSNTNQDQSE